MVKNVQNYWDAPVYFGFGANKLRPWKSVLYSKKCVFLNRFQEVIKENKILAQLLNETI